MFFPLKGHAHIFKHNVSAGFNKTGIPLQNNHNEIKIVHIKNVLIINLIMDQS